MNKVLELREKRANLWNASQKFREERSGEDGCLSETDQMIYEGMQSDIEHYGKEIERLEREAAAKMQAAETKEDGEKMPEQRYNLRDERGNIIAENMDINSVLLFVRAYFEQYGEEAKMGMMDIKICARKMEE